MNHVSVVAFVVGAGALLVLWLVWRARCALRAVRTLRSLTGAPGGSLGRAVLLASLITGVQWFVLTHGTTRAVLLALAIPALFAGSMVSRLMPTAVRSGRKGGKR